MSAVRRHIMLGTAGHVDHGKTALVKLLTGCETDTLSEEKERGLTIDIGFAPCRLADDRIVGIVDVPGHVDFIRNMVAGAHGLDVVILVVAADDGIMPQTQEHLHILTLMGLRHGLVALTKVDLVEPGRLADVTADLRRLLSATFLESAPICPLSNITGEGFGEFFDALNDVTGRCEDRPGTGRFRVWVEDVFPIRGAGTVLTGIPTRGTVRVGDELRLLPAGLNGRVRRMQVYGHDDQEGHAGECVALNLPEIDHVKARRGMVLGDADTAPPASMLEGQLRILQTIKGPVPDMIEAHMHIGTAAVNTTVALLEATEILPGMAQFVQLRLSEPLPITPGERFVLRANLPGQTQSGLVTIGGGRVLATSDRRLRRRKQWTLDWLAARREAIDDSLRWCELMLLESRAPVDMQELGGRCQMLPEELAASLSELRCRGAAMELPGKLWTHSSTVNDAMKQLVSTLQAFHTANPQRAGMAKDELARAASISSGVFEAAFERALQGKMIERAGAVITRAGWRPAVSSQEELLCQAISQAFRKAGFAGPGATDLAQQLGAPVEKIEQTIRLLAERGELVKLDERTFIHRDGLEKAKAIVLDFFRQKTRFSTMDFRDALGVSRKYAVPLLDYLDKVRFTVRTGHDRTPGAEAKKAMAPLAPRSL